MNDRLELMKKRMRAGEHHSVRQAAPIDILSECEAENLSWLRRVARLVRRQCEAEQVVIAPDEQIVFTRTLPAVPPVYNSEDSGPFDCRSNPPRIGSGQQYLRRLELAAFSRFVGPQTGRVGIP